MTRLGQPNAGANSRPCSRAPRFGFRAAAVLCLLTISLLQGCRYPRDVEGTLTEIRGGVMDVGVTENPPWVIRNGDVPAGLEPEIVRALAQELDADVRWHWGTETELLGALQQLQLQLVIGGLVESKRLSTAVSPTKPYFKSRSTVGFAESETSPHSLNQSLKQSLKGVTVFVPAINHLHKSLIEHNANPEIRDVDQLTQGAVAAPAWWLRAHGFTPGPWDLMTDRHVMALPKGENAWMMSVQRHLNSLSGVGERLERLESTR